MNPIVCNDIVVLDLVDKAELRCPHDLYDMVSFVLRLNELLDYTILSLLSLEE